MSKSSRKAGRNIRGLAINRRIEAITSFALAGIFLCAPFFVKALENYVKQIPSLNLSKTQFALNLPPIVYIFFVVIALLSVAKGIFLWKRANHADQGAKGEEDTAQEISQLEQDGWQVEFNLSLGNRLGDVDIICISPQDKAYSIDVKSHRGEVTTDGKQLYRRWGNTKNSFEKNFLEQAMKQALQVKKQKNLSFVTPIVAFSDAKVTVPAGKVQKVYVVEKSKLVALLKSLG
ncbi:MAG: NERD domain-containing protein [Coleofasciculaceae cyanobacterium SM2_1_6]|nr:NERD domain-containing protein [Coleofasciculaceae cyanobacterium SM2_1_6]